MENERQAGAERERAHAWIGALQHAFDCMLSDDDGRSRPRPRVIAASSNGVAVEVELRWLSGRRYCCGEPVCFLATYDRAWWGRFRAALAEVSDRDPPPMSMRMHAVVEDGALFTNREQIGCSARSEAEVYAPREEHERNAK